MKISQSSKGFTIVELMIATGVFSVVLLLCTYGLLQVGRTYYKGITASRTQETARLILTEVTEAIKLGGGTVVTPAQAGGGTPGFYCIGTKRFSYVRNRLLTDGSPQHVLAEDEEPACSTATGPQGMNGTLEAGSRELMNTRMRLSHLTIARIPNTDLYSVSVRVVSGEDSQLEDVAPADGVLDSCRNTRAGSQFCSASELSTVVQKRVR